MSVNLEDVQAILDGLNEDFEDPEALYWVEEMQDRYEMALRAEYGFEKGDYYGDE